VFTADGKVAGFTVLQLPDSDESGGLGGLTGSGQDMSSSYVLPAAAVRKATERAREVAEEEE
jgi:hypothetical protein